MTQGFSNISFGQIGKVVQMVNTQTGEYTNCTTAFPHDDTAPPQNTEGTEVMTLSIIPTDSSSKLRIDVVANGGNDTDSISGVGLFQDSIADALACQFMYGNPGDTLVPSTFTYWMTAGTTNQIDFAVRMGNTVSDQDFNGRNGIRNGGGVHMSSITITEIAV